MRKSTRKMGKGQQKSSVSTNPWDIEDKALKEFEKALGLVHKKNYQEALDRFRGIVETYPRERELLDRANVYIRVCQGNMKKGSNPKQPDALFYHGVMRANEADFDGAVGYLSRALEASPKDERVLYVMASTLALKGERQDAIKHLRDAVQINPTNRIHARNDPDFEPLRDDESFQDLIYPEEI